MSGIGGLQGGWCLLGPATQAQGWDTCQGVQTPETFTLLQTLIGSERLIWEILERNRMQPMRQIQPETNTQPQTRRRD